MSSESLRLVYFGLFDNCNARCNMCDCWVLPRSALSFEHYVTVLGAVLELCPESLRFTGGEPLLLPRLPELVRQVSDTGARVSVISNGRILASKIPAMADAGCDEIVLSIDGYGERHDSIRGTPGLFDRILVSIERMHRVGIPYGVNTVLQAAGIEDLARLANLFRDQLHPPDWWHLIPVRDRLHLVPNKRQRGEIPGILQKIRSTMVEAGCTVIVADDPFATDGCAPCSVPAFTAYVRADTGEMYGCNMLAHVAGTVGNVLAAGSRPTWDSERAASLRTRCAAAGNNACSRCDAGSRMMNYFLRDLPASPAHGRP